MTDQTPRPLGPTTVDGDSWRCDVTGCPTPRNPLHYHCGHCASGEITGMYGHHGDPGGCPIVDLDQLPGAVADWVREHPGAAAVPVQPTPEHRFPAGASAYRVRWPDPRTGKRRNRYFAYRDGATGTCDDTLAAALDLLA